MTGGESPERATSERVRAWLESLPPVELPSEGELLRRIYADDDAPPP